jgi:hypothetical protein
MAPTSGRGIDSVSPAFVTRRTLADAAVDGLVPEANLASPELMLEEAKRALAVWIERLANGEPDAGFYDWRVLYCYQQ